MFGNFASPPSIQEMASLARRKNTESEQCGCVFNREVAEQLVSSEGTVKNRISNILSPLGLRDRTQAAMYGREQALLSSSSQKRDGSLLTIDKHRSIFYTGVK